MNTMFMPIYASIHVSNLPVCLRSHSPAVQRGREDAHASNDSNRPLSGIRSSKIELTYGSAASVFPNES